MTRLCIVLAVLAVVVGPSVGVAQKASATSSQFSLTAESNPPEGWMKGGWGEVVLEVANNSGAAARIVRWEAHWEVNGEQTGPVSHDRDVIDLPAGKTTKVVKGGWLSPDVVDEAKPGAPTWCGTLAIEADGVRTDLKYRIQIPEAVLPEATVLLKGKHVGIELMKSRVAGFTSKDRVLRWMDECYEAMQELTGYTPYHGELIVIKECPRNPVWAYSGNPIQMNTQYMGGLIEEMNAGLMPFGWVHELGHDFDIPEELYDDWYVWNGRMCEGMANFKLFYAYMAIPSRDWKAKWTYDKEEAFPAPAGGVALEGRHFVEAVFLFGADRYLMDQSRTYEEDDAPSFMMRMAYAYGWDIYRIWFRTYKQMADAGHKPPESAEDKISLMAAILSEAAGVDLEPVFERWRYPVTEQSVKAMYERYPVKEAVADVKQALSRAKGAM